MKWFIFFLSVCIQFCGLNGMEKQQPQSHHSRTRSVSDPSLMDKIAQVRAQEKRPESPTEKKLRAFAMRSNFRYTGEYKPVEQQKTEPQT